MKLYSLTGTQKVSHPDHGEFEPEEDGAFEFPHDLGVQVHGTHIDGKPVWETDGERSLRLVAEEDARRRDPATLVDTLREFIDASKTSGESDKAPATKTK